MSEYYPPQLIGVTNQTSRDESGKQVDKCCGAPQSNKPRGIPGKPDPSQLIQLKKLTPAVINGEAILTSQAVVLDTDAQCIFSGIERNITGFNNEGDMKEKMMSSNKTKM